MQIVNGLEIVNVFGISEDSFAEIVNSLQIVMIFTNLRNHCIYSGLFKGFESGRRAHQNPTRCIGFGIRRVDYVVRHL